MPHSEVSYLAEQRRLRWFGEKIEVSRKERGTAQDIIGLGVSPGTARGPVFFADNWDELAQVPEGAILISSCPNPSFVPWFDKIQGLITETGGVLSHGFIAARELGVPAISGVKRSEFIQGHIISLDGSTGRIQFG
jgi:pyruvate,water dikinase